MAKEGARTQSSLNVSQAASLVWHHSGNTGNKPSDIPAHKKS